MRPFEIWWLIEAKRPVRRFGKWGTTEYELDELLESAQRAKRIMPDA